VQSLLDFLYSVNYHAEFNKECSLFDNFLRDEYENLILVFFLLLRHKTELMLDRKFFNKDLILLGKPFMDPLTIVLDKKSAEYIVDNTFEEQVYDLKEESMGLLYKHFEHEDQIKLIDFYTIILRFFVVNLGKDEEGVTEH